MRFDNLREDVRRWGPGKALYMRIARRIERGLNARVFVIHTRVLDPNVEPDTIPTDCSARLLTLQELIEFARDPALGLDEDSVAKAYARREACFGYLERGALVAYTWKSNQPTRAEAGLWVHLGEGYSYGYKTFTLPSHRGRHLQEHLIHASERWRLSQGCRYNIDYIHILNLSSIVANRRYGNRPIGYAGYVRWFGRTIPFHTPAVKATGFLFFVPAAGEVDRVA